MKRIINYTTWVIFAAFITGCTLIEDIFEAGFWVGLIAAIVIVLVIFIIVRIIKAIAK